MDLDKPGYLPAGGNWKEAEIDSSHWRTCVRDLLGGAWTAVALASVLIRLSISASDFSSRVFPIFLSSSSEQVCSARPIHADATDLNVKTALVALSDVLFLILLIRSIWYLETLVVFLRPLIHCI